MKVNESTNAANLLMVGMQAKNSLSDDTKDFASILSETADTKNSSVSNTDSRLSDSIDRTGNKQNGVDETKSESQQQVNDKVKTDDKYQTVEEHPEITDKKTETESVSEEEQSDIPADMDKVVEVLSSLLNDLSQILNISVEDLSKLMEENNFSAVDLLNVDNMKQLLLTVNHSEATDLLVNEELNSQLNAVIEEIDSYLNVLPEQQMKAAENISIDTLVDFVMKDAGFNLADGTVYDFESVDDVSDVVDMAVSEDIEEPVVVVEDNRTDLSRQNNNDNMSQGSTSDTKQESKNPIENRSLENDKGFSNPILQNIQDSLNQIEETSFVRPTVSPTQVLDQIVEQVKVQMNQDNTTLQMQLYPEHLGRIQINVVSKEGVMTAQIVAENDAAKQAIEGGLASLKETLENQNIKVEAVEVMVSTTGFQQNDEKNGFSEEQSHGKKNRKLDLSSLEEDDLEPEDLREVEKMKATGSSVSYSV